MARKNDRKLGWHFLPKDRVLTNGDGRKVKLGVELRMRDGSGMPSCCNNGMHASEKVSQAASFKRGPVLSRVEVWGHVDVNPDKFCGRSRRVLWMKEILQKDVREIALSMRSPNLAPSGSFDVSYTLRGLSAHDGVAFDRAVGAWARKHGAHDKVTTLPPEQPVMTMKDLLKLLAPRIVRTEKEIRRDIGDFYDLTPESINYNDRLEELLEECDSVRRVEDIDGEGTDGYVLQTLRRRR